MDAAIQYPARQKMQTRIEKIARCRKAPTSHILHEALSTSVQSEEEGVSPYESMKELIGIARGNGLTDLSQITGKRFIELLELRQRRSQK